MKIPLKIAAHDPGGMVDNFGTLTSDLTTQKIMLTDAMTWNKTKTPNFSYDLVMERLHRFQEAFKFDYNICESNNTGVPVIQGLVRRYKMRVIPITTVGNITNPKTIREGKAMDKEKIVEWINLLREKGIIVFPAKMTTGLYELKAELDNFGGKRRGGRVVHEALRGHDDLVSCLKLTVHFAMKKILRLPELTPIMRFNGAGTTVEQQLEFGLSEKGRAVAFAKSYITKKGTLFDKIDVRLPRGRS